MFLQASAIIMHVYLLSELSLGIYDQLSPLITYALLELHNRLVGLPPIPGTVDLICLAISAVAGLLFHQPNLPTSTTSLMLQHEA